MQNISLIYSEYKLGTSTLIPLMKEANMCWLANPLKNRSGEKRQITEFIIFPKCLNGEWRWLEKATYEQVVKPEFDYFGMYKYHWVSTKWID